MTFYEAAVLILQRAGHPLHAKEITEIAISESLLSHVGKEPEVTMASRLAAMAKSSRDRRLVAVEPDTFGLTDWNIVAVPEALEQSGLPEVHEEDGPQLRERERHPKVDKENVRTSGRGDRHRKRDEGKRKKRLPPVAELVFELLGRIGKPVPLFELAAAARERNLGGDDLGREGLEAMLVKENERREEENRKPHFVFFDEGLVGLQGGAEPSGEAHDYPALVAKALERIAEERKPAPTAAAGKGAGSVERAVDEQRQRAIRQLRKRLMELEAPALEAVVSAMLDSMGYRELRVAKRHKEGALFTSRRRMGLTEVRFAIRVLQGAREVRREDIAELRKDMASHSAQMGVVVSAADVTREARNETSQPAASLVTLLCADAFADQLAERGVGVTTRTIQYVEYDETAFRALLRRAPARTQAEGATQEPRRSDMTADERRERRDRERKEWRERREKAREERSRQRADAEAGEAGGATPAEGSGDSTAASDRGSREEAGANGIPVDGLEATAASADRERREKTGAGENLAEPADTEAAASDRGSIGAGENPAEPVDTKAASAELVSQEKPSAGEDPAAGGGAEAGAPDRAARTEAGAGANESGEAASGDSTGGGGCAEGSGEGPEASGGAGTGVGDRTEAEAEAPRRANGDEA